MLEGKGFVLGQALELVGLGSLTLTCLELWGGLEQLYSTGMNSRFSLAVHVLTLLATQPEERVTSGFLAMSIGTNPVVIRRLMAKLREAGLVTSKGAAGGGWMLARPAEKILLTQVRSALEDEVAMRMHKESPHPECPVGKGVHQALSLVYGHVDTAIDKALMRMSVADVLADALGKGEEANKT